MTFLIAVLAAAIGLALAYGLVFIHRRDNPIANRLISGYNALIAGIPAAVILMVLYYIIFASAKFSPVLVAVVRFALIYCSRAYGIIWNGVTSVDGGQREAALALGYGEARAFREVILPQSERYYRPLLYSQFIMLLKETSVAGYITVLELTRAGDLIRSRTMEAFFPLISVAANVDFYEMMASLESFCRLQFMGKRASNECRLAVEEMATRSGTRRRGLCPPMSGAFFSPGDCI